MRFHLPARDHGVTDPAPALYMIRINGHLGAIVLAEIEEFGLDLLEVRQLEPNANNWDQVTVAHLDGR